MDPVFGRGYCEETDWTLRAQSLGYRICLSPSAFVYHRGQGSTSDAGLLPAGHGTVPENEQIIDLRYPLFRRQVEAFMRSEILDILRSDAHRKLLNDAARQWGYDVELDWTPEPARTSRVLVTLDRSRDGQMVPTARFHGFVDQIPVHDDDLTGSIVYFFGRNPTTVRSVGPTNPLRDLTETFETLGAKVVHQIGYPARV